MENIFSTTEFKMTYVQDADSNSDESNDQELEIFIDNAGGGDYYIIKTDRWAFDKIDDLISLLKKFKDKHDKIKEA